MRKRLADILVFAFLSLLFVFAAFPLVYTFFASFKSNLEIVASPASLFPKEFTFDNYITAWKSEDFNVPILAFNSMYYSLFCVAVSVFQAAVGGYTFARIRFTGGKVLFAVLSALMFVNLGGATSVPLIGIAKSVGLNNSLFGLMLIKMFGVGIVNIYLVRGFVQNIPRELDEAATIDGCGSVMTLFYVIFPLLKPVLATVGILAFQSSWNEVIMPVVFTMNNPLQRTLSAGLYSLRTSSGAAAQWNLMMAGSVVSMVPVLFVYAFGSKYFVSGIVSGAVKG